MSFVTIFFGARRLTWHAEGIKAAFAVCGQNIPFTATFTGGARKGNVNVVYEAV